MTTRTHAHLLQRSTLRSLIHHPGTGRAGRSLLRGMVITNAAALTSNKSVQALVYMAGVSYANKEKAL